MMMERDKKQVDSQKADDSISFVAVRQGDCLVGYLLGRRIGLSRLCRSHRR